MTSLTCLCFCPLERDVREDEETLQDVLMIHGNETLCFKLSRTRNSMNQFCASPGEGAPGRAGETGAALASQVEGWWFKSCRHVFFFFL